MDIPFSITLPPGVVKNDSAFASKGRYIDSSFVRPWQGKMQKWKGWGNYFNIDFDEEPARGGQVWNTLDGTTLSCFGTASKLWLIKEGVKYDITPQGYAAGLVDTAPGNSGYGDGGYGSGPYGGGWDSVAGQGGYPRVWTFGRWGQDLVANPRGEEIYTWIYGDGDTLGITTTATGDGYTKALLHFEGVDASTTFTDSNLGGSAHTWTAAGNAQIDTAQFVFGAASGLFDGTGDYISTPDHADFTLGALDFFLNLRIRPNTTGSTLNIAGQANAAGLANADSAWSLVRDSSNVIVFNLVQGTTVTTITGTTALSAATWYDVTVVRTGDVLKMFIGGVQEGGDVAFTGSVNDSASVLAIGRAGAITGSEWNGWIDEFNLSVGIARETANFTPRATAWVASSTTILEVASTTGIEVGMRVTGDGIAEDSFVTAVGSGTITISEEIEAPLDGTSVQFDMPAIPISGFDATGTSDPDALVPTSCLGIFVTDDRTLVALGAAQGGDDYDALNIAWCDREDYTVWTSTTLNTAGAIRCEAGNQIMGACQVFGGWIILTDLSAHPFTFQGGDDVFGLDRLGTKSGAIGPQAMVTLDGIAYWMGYSSMYRYNGKVEQINCDVQQYVFSDVAKNRSYKICAGTNAQYGEVLWFYPSSTSVENNRYFAVNVLEPAWSVGDGLSRTTWIDINPLFNTPLGTDGENFKLYQHESGTTADGEPIEYLLESGDLDMKQEGGTIQASSQHLRLKKIVPDFAYVTGEHNLEIDARSYPGETADVTTKGPYALESNGKGHMFNPKARGRLFRFRQTGTGDFRQGNFEAWGAPDGGRGG